MKNTIWKFTLEVSDMQKVIMPIGAEILAVQAQNEIPCLWALVDPDAEKEIRYIEIFGTGHPVNIGMGISRKYISTFQLQGGALVFHSFEYTGL